MMYSILNDLNSLEEIARDVTADLRQGCSLVWLFPNPHLLEQMTALVRSECGRWSLSDDEVSLVEVECRDRLPGAVLAERLDLELPGSGNSWTPEALLASPNLPDVVVLRDVEQLPVQQQELWVQFVTQWTHTTITSASPRVLLIPVVAGLAVKVQPDVRLRVHRLWRYTSQLELQGVARGYGGSDPASQVWNEYGYASLAAGDPLLLGWLLEERDVDGEALWERLLEYGRQAGWTADDLVAAGAHKLCDLPWAARVKDWRDFPTVFERLWGMGAVTYTNEYGLELQTAAAAVLGRQDLVDHRLWRGQVQALMPVLDAVRQTLCHYLTRHHGPDWINLAKPKYDFEISGTPNWPLSEFNHLSQVFRNSLLRVRGRLDLSEMVQELRDWRNSLAHYSPISRAGVTRLFQVVKQLESLR